MNKDTVKEHQTAVLMAKDATLRDLFAIAALAGQNLSGIGWQHRAKQAYEAADAMLAERGKRNDST